jgi:2-C-methyl-D-erythritol 4-phosphate cytidylyltransferase
MRTVAVVLAGGSGNRFGSGQPKQFQLLRGRSLLEHCVSAFDSAPGIDDVLVVAAADALGPVRDMLHGYGRLVDVIKGGEARTDSTAQALAWLTGRAGDVTGSQDWKVLFHDAARPLIDQRVIAECIAALDRYAAVGVVVPTADTIVEVSDGAFARVLARSTLARCQTPQGFRLSVIRRAYDLAAADTAFATMAATDDCGVVLRYLPDVPIGIVRGNERNIKITYAADLAVAEALLDFQDPRP